MHAEILTQMSTRVHTHGVCSLLSTEATKKVSAKVTVKIFFSQNFKTHFYTEVQYCQISQNACFCVQRSRLERYLRAYFGWKYHVHVWESLCYQQFFLSTPVCFA